MTALPAAIHATRGEMCRLAHHIAPRVMQLLAERAAAIAWEALPTDHGTQLSTHDALLRRQFIDTAVQRYLASLTAADYDDLETFIVDEWLRKQE